MTVGGHAAGFGCGGGTSVFARKKGDWLRSVDRQSYSGKWERGFFTEND